MTTPDPEALRLIRAAVNHLTSDEFTDAGQDQSLVIEMVQAMLADVIDTDGLAPISVYVAKYCDVLGRPAGRPASTPSVSPPRSPSPLSARKSRLAP